MVDRNVKVTRAVAKVLKAGGVDFAVLGAEECCTGDPARRVGGEVTFQVCAKTNLETLERYGVRKIVTACPHCFNTLENEYPDFGGRFEVVHHSELIAELVRSGRLRLSKKLDSLTYHDPCYLGRHNEVYDAPREVLRAVSTDGGFQELPRNRSRALCCGAGGGYAFMDDASADAHQPDARRGGDGFGGAHRRGLLPVLHADVRGRARRGRTRRALRRRATSQRSSPRRSRSRDERAEPKSPSAGSSTSRRSATSRAATRTASGARTPTAPRRSSPTDGVMDTGDRPPLVGRDAIRDAYRAILPSSDLQPFVHNHVIELDGDRATGSCHLDLRVTRDGRSLIGSGCYEDRYVRAGDGWNFASRRLTMHFLVPLREGWAEGGTTRRPSRHIRWR